MSSYKITKIQHNNCKINTEISLIKQSRDQGDYTIRGNYGKLLNFSYMCKKLYSY